MVGTGTGRHFAKISIYLDNAKTYHAQLWVRDLFACWWKVWWSFFSPLNIFGASNKVLQHSPKHETWMGTSYRMYLKRCFFSPFNRRRPDLKAFPRLLADRVDGSWTCFASWRSHHPNFSSIFSSVWVGGACQMASTRIAEPTVWSRTLAWKQILTSQDWALVLLFPASLRSKCRLKNCDICVTCYMKS